MCLAVPARILSIRVQPPPGASEPSGAAPATDDADDDGLWRMAEVDFGGVRQQVSLACLPEATVGDRVLVHVGLALSLVEDDPA
ncbi:HypC/HybG/HupF family hydrogenase formation chaperone [Cyanobium sp. Cruz CV13-4-11]|jgi:hydrogenase expression/formation protein HypC|uniref:HypC/HybG/HupF family hydrogenase formation chaperone n=1 Tax=unclassified Cyanobium TaxID=2627006 RepID=UPI0020CCB7D0|nr:MULTISPECIES: HypC/HybG/HupF family hydrogenase formation chaperone [unclassified Cyanobium]MCP9899826.1 HypC/HybG/HupF family hydrogenase formation chaperone [Cyanobium sp. Cruz CV11-17]MCP9918857.1 HypC/HybG/HupF family hydrogenase formation chaperone [Cyanobium sp. Cruz CV13-4-11]